MFHPSTSVRRMAKIDYDQLSTQLIKHESLETHAYSCSANKITIGVGRNIDPSDGLGITEDEARYLLKNDINRVMRECSRNLTWFDELDGVRQEAIINMVFNLGITRYLKFKKHIEAMENKDYEMAGAQAIDSLWAKQVGYRALELANQISSGNRE